MKKKKKKVSIIAHTKIPKQVQRQMQAKYESVEQMQEKAMKRDELLQKIGFLKSHAGISSSYGILNGIKVLMEEPKRR